MHGEKAKWWVYKDVDVGGVSHKGPPYILLVKSITLLQCSLVQFSAVCCPSYIPFLTFDVNASVIDYDLAAVCCLCHRL